MLHLSLLFLVALTAIASISSVSAFLPRQTVAASTLFTLSASSSTAAETTDMPEVQVGDKIPSVDLMELKEAGGKPETVNLSDLIAGKRVAIFGVPGAFTPGCSKSHLPSFMEAQADLEGNGVDMTICVATNDAYVMEVSDNQCSNL